MIGSLKTAGDEWFKKRRIKMCKRWASLSSRMDTGECKSQLFRITLYLSFPVLLYQIVWILSVLRITVGWNFIATIWDAIIYVIITIICRKIFPYIRSGNAFSCFMFLTCYVVCLLHENRETKTTYRDNRLSSIQINFSRLWFLIFGCFCSQKRTFPAFFFQKVNAR